MLECNPSVHGALGLSEGCGLSVATYVSPSSRNPQLAGELVVAVVNGSYGAQQMRAVATYVNEAVARKNAEEAQTPEGRSPGL
jgi:hypothetical protein